MSMAREECRLPDAEPACNQLRNTMSFLDQTHTSATQNHICHRSVNSDTDAFLPTG